MKNKKTFDLPNTMQLVLQNNSITLYSVYDDIKFHQLQMDIKAYIEQKDNNVFIINLRDLPF